MSEEAKETPKYTRFSVAGEERAVGFVETTEVIKGVSCDVYRFVGDETKDLAIVTVEPGYMTPRQRVMAGVRTAEGYVSGPGTLTIRPSDGGETKKYNYDSSKNPDPIEVKHGEIMQWSAAEGNTPLVFYELCEPPYEEGRFENLPD